MKITHVYLRFAVWSICFWNLWGVMGLAEEPSKPQAPSQTQSSSSPQTVLPLVETVEAQPLIAQIKRLLDLLEQTGQPLNQTDKQSLEAAMAEPDSTKASQQIQKILDPYCLVGVNINPESHVKAAQGVIKPELVEKGWRQFLIKVHNEARVIAELNMQSLETLSLHGSPADEVRNRWLDYNWVTSELLKNPPKLSIKQPSGPTLTGLSLEYHLLQLYSRDVGKREAKLTFTIGHEEQNSSSQNIVDIPFQCLPTQELTFHIIEENNEPATAAFVIRDSQKRIYPSPSKRIAPDFLFQYQVYRTDGEKEKLPPGTYTMEYSRGPESIAKTMNLTMGNEPQTATFKIERWIDPSKLGWWSGDHHIHAAGCAHYQEPTQGVLAADMIRHTMGEDVKVGCNLTWGPCFDYQKNFFTGAIDKLSKYPYLLRYDIEVSGFGSHKSGHLCLLRLKDQIYPGGNSKNHWPTLGLNTLKWAKKQGAVTGCAHSGIGLKVNSKELPNYIIPGFDGIGANEYIVNVTHQVSDPDNQLVPAIDFISTVNTHPEAELNIWYHTLNCGFRTRISGETDFPCVSGERVGLGRSYVKLDGKLDFDEWCEGIRNGRSYTGEGRSHLLEFSVESLSDPGKSIAVGKKGSELQLGNPGSVRLKARVAALLGTTPDLVIRNRRPDARSFKQLWHIEHARIDDSREIPVEVIVNGYPVAKQNIIADGKLQDISFDIKIERSSWVALRIFPSSHTNPIFVLVGEKPIRASKRSADWCLKGVDQCWSQKEQFISDVEKEEAKAAYNRAREVYQKILSECDID